VPCEPLQRVLVEGVKVCLSLLRGGRVEVFWGACMNEWASGKDECAGAAALAAAGRDGTVDG
jgi:hypothetical protein